MARPGRLLPLALAAALAGGCEQPSVLKEPVAGAPVSLWLAGASLTSFVVLQRGVFDAVYSLATGQDCSVIHLERRGEYCRSIAVAQPAPFCTRTIGQVDCWTVAEPYGPQRPVTDIPPPPPRRERLRWGLSPF